MPPSGVYVSLPCARVHIEDALGITAPEVLLTNQGDVLTLDLAMSRDVAMHRVALSLWSLTGASTAVLSRRQSNSRAIH